MYLTTGRDPEVLNGLLGYVLAYCAKRHGIQIHAAVFMSNHYHIDLTDPHGNLVGFKQQLNSTIARAMNARRNRFGGFWDRDTACDTKRPTDDETFMDLVYTIANPVSAGLVKRSEHWPGFTTAGWRFGETRSFRRPAWFFDPKEMPDAVPLTLTRPPVFAHLSDDELYTRLEAEVHRREQEVQRELRQTDRRFVGLIKLARQHWDRAARGYEERFSVTPRVASSCKWKRLVQLNRDREWERQYAAARARLLAGLEAIFPAGTFLMRRLAGVTVAEQLRC
jgi:putative transposase